MRWVILHNVGQDLGLEDAVAVASVHYAVDQGWLNAEGDPAHSICLTDAGRRLAGTAR